MIKLSSSGYRTIVNVECPHCGRHYPFECPSGKRIKKEDLIRGDWRKIKIKFLFLFFKKILVCPICAVEDSLKKPKSESLI